MKHTLRYFLVPVVIALVLAGCTRRGHSVEEKADWFVEKVSNELDLSASQQATLAAIKTDVLARKDLFDSWRYHNVFDEALAQLEAESLDKEKLNSMLARQEAQRMELRMLLVDKAAEFHAVLTPQQRARAAERLGKLNDRRKR